MSQAVVADFPVPVAPSSTVSVSPALTRSASALIAAGWSPEGSNSLTTRNRPRVGRTSVDARTGRRYDGGTTERPASPRRPAVHVTPRAPRGDDWGDTPERTDRWSCPRRRAPLASPPVGTRSSGRRQCHPGSPDGVSGG